MPASTIPAAQDALLAAIQAQLPTVSVDWPTVELPHDAEFVTIEDAQEVRRVWSVFSQFEETYLLRVHVNTLHAGGTFLAARSRLWELVAAAEQAVVANLTLTGSVDDARPDSVVPNIVPFDSGWWAEADVLFACRAFGRP